MVAHFLLWIIALTVLIAVGLVRIRPPAGRGRSGPWPLEPALAVLSEPEQVLYRRLVAALPDYLVLPQVQLIQALRFKRGRRDQAVWNRICQLSVDFLIVRGDTSIVAAVELDDSSHRAPRRHDADARKSHAFKSAGVALIRWQVTRLPDVESIRSALAGLDGDGAVRCGANATELTSRAVPIR